MEKTLESKLDEFFIEHDIENEEVKTALRKVFDTTCEVPFLHAMIEEAESLDKEYFYDVNFTALLENYVHVFKGVSAVSHIGQLFGMYGMNTFYVSDDLQGLVIVDM